MIRELIALVVIGVPFYAQEIKFPANFAKLAEKAEDVVDVTLDGSLLGLAGRFLSENKEDEASAKRIIGGLKGIYIRSFEFAKAGEYSESDVEEIRQQLRSPEWVRVVTVRSKNKNSENADIFLKKEGDKVAGLTVLASEPTKLTVVHILGSISVEDLGKLQGNLGIPNVKLGPVTPEKEN